MNSILISIIVPVYNIEKYVEQCILSLINQTYSNIEIILVNDGSTDNSGSICEEYAKRDHRINLINKKNEGLINARKSGILASKGELIAYVDGDDWVKPEMYESLINYLLASDADVIIAGHIEAWHNTQEVQLNTIPAGVYSSENLTEVHDSMICSGRFSNFGIFSYVWGKLFKRDVIIKHQLAVDDSIFIGEDAACLYPCLLSAAKIQIVNDANYFYRQRIGSMIKTPDPKEIEKVSAFYDYMKNIFLDHSKSKSLINQLNYLTVSLLTVRSNITPKNYSNLILYPFEKVEPNDKIVIYCAGTFGQLLNKKINNNNSISMVLWVDEIHHEYQYFGLDVSAVELINGVTYDKVLIAHIDETFSLIAEKKLLAMNVPKEKICRVIHHEESEVEQTLLGYGINL